MTDRSALVADFLSGTPWQDWHQEPLAGDASARRYLRLSHGGDTVILMDAPPENGDDTQPFVEVATLLRSHGFSAPRILAQDAAQGFLLLSDLGSDDYAKWLNAHPADEATLYRAAADVLLQLEAVAPPAHLTRMTPEVGAQMLDILGPHYCFGSTADLQTQMQAAVAAHAPEPTTLALRDYHAENLIWRSDKMDVGRVGLLDFQDAFAAPPGYDLASLVRDARRDVSAAVMEEIIRYFSAHTKTKGAFRTSLACLGVQRNLRILGVFARLITEHRKQRYLAFMPRVWRHIMTDLQDPALADLRQAVLDTVPVPTPQKCAELAA